MPKGFGSGPSAGPDKTSGTEKLLMEFLAIFVRPFINGPKYGELVATIQKLEKEAFARGFLAGGRRYHGAYPNTPTERTDT